MGILMAILSGILMSVQGVWNTGVTEKSSVWVAAGLVQLTAFLVCVGAWWMNGRPPVSDLLQVEPKYMLLGGVFGAAITWTVIQSMERMGPAYAVLFIVVAQIIVAYLIELLGLFGVEKQPLSWNKVLGAGIAIVGLVLFQNK